MLRQGEIVLIPVPLSDLKSVKNRPVIIISNDSYNQKTEDIIVVAMTSNPAPVEYGFTITSTDLIRGQLTHSGKVRVDKIFSLSQSIASKRIGLVSNEIIGHILGKTETNH